MTDRFKLVKELQSLVYSADVLKEYDAASFAKRQSVKIVVDAFDAVNRVMPWLNGAQRASFMNGSNSERVGLLDAVATNIRTFTDEIVMKRCFGRSWPSPRRTRASRGVDVVVQFVIPTKFYSDDDLTNKFEVHLSFFQKRKKKKKCGFFSSPFFWLVLIYNNLFFVDASEQQRS